jgi:hypothetical protein
LWKLNSPLTASSGNPRNPGTPAGPPGQTAGRIGRCRTYPGPTRLRRVQQARPGLVISASHRARWARHDVRHKTSGLTRLAAAPG